MLFTTSLLLLISVVLSASFTSSKDESKLDYKDIKSKSQLMEELSEKEGVSELAAVSIPEWAQKVIATNAPVSEDVARWVMLKHFHQSDRDESFFHYVMDNFGYVSLVKDLADYRENNMHTFICNYLNKHRLRHFPHLPQSLRNAAEQVSNFHGFVFEYVLPLLSDHSINHPKVKEVSVSGVGQAHAFWKAEFRLTLICHCLGGVKLKADFKPIDLTDLAIIDEVSHLFPEQMSAFIAGLKGRNPHDYLEIVRSDQPPAIAFWKGEIDHLNLECAKPNFQHDILNIRVPLLRALIHYLFQSHPQWIAERLGDLNPNNRVAYFYLHPEDTQFEALPNEMPPLEFMTRGSLGPSLIPFYQALVKKYGLKQMTQAANDRRRRTGYCDFGAKAMLQLIRISEMKLENQSFNKFITKLHYILGKKGSSLDSWLIELIFNKEPTTWIFKLMEPKPQ